MKSRPPRLQHQTDAIRAILQRSGLLLSYGTGMGKSRIMLEAAQMLVTREGQRRPILFLVPNSIIEETLDQLAQWLGGWGIAMTLCMLRKPRIYKVKALQFVRKQYKQRSSGRPCFVILSHEDLSYKPIVDAIKNISWSAIFLDEASRFRNNSRRSRALASLQPVADHRVAASGSFVTNSPMDIWYALKFAVPEALQGFNGRGGRDLFMRHYCIMGGFGGTKPIGLRPERREELEARLNPHRLQRTLSDVRDMPDRMLLVRRVALSAEQAVAYAQMEDTLRYEITNANDEDFAASVSTYVARMQKLQEIGAGFIRDPETKEVHTFAHSAKHDELLELLRDPTPTIVYTWWVPEFADTCLCLSRADIQYATHEYRRPFLDGEVPVLVSPLGKGAYGLNLDRARRMIYMTLPWDLDIYSQSQERNWRLTTQDSKVIVHLLARDTIDEYVRRRLLAKTEMALSMTRSQALEMLRGNHHRPE